VKKRSASTVEEEEEEADDAGEGTSGKVTAPAKKRKTAAAARGGKKGGMKPPKICTTNSAVRDFSQPGLKLAKDKFILGMLGEYCQSCLFELLSTLFELMYYRSEVEHASRADQVQRGAQFRLRGG
jgi:hypothetical protein